MVYLPKTAEKALSLLPLQLIRYKGVTKLLFKRSLIGLQKGVSKSLKGHLLQAKRALIRTQLSPNKNRVDEKYLQRGLLTVELLTSKISKKPTLKDTVFSTL